MSDNSSDNKIVIKFEIQVPVAGGTPVIIQGGPAPQSPAPPILAPLVPPRIRIERVTIPHLVKVAGTNTNGVICVTASSEDPVPVDVRVENFRPTDAIPNQPPNDAVQAIADGLPIITGGPKTFSSWHVDTLPNAQCAMAVTGVILPFNTLAVWRLLSGETLYDLQTINFQGQCSDRTDCEPAQPFGPDPSPLQVLDTVPSAWRIEARGFGCDLEALNGTWILVRDPQPAEGYVAWSCGGDGVHKPRLDLYGKTWGSEPLELHLSHRGNRLVYRLQRKDLNPLGANRFKWSRDQGAPAGCRFPTELLVVPA